MEMQRCLSLIVVTALAMSVSVVGQRLTFSPDPIVEGTTTTLTVRCDVSATSKLYVIKIIKSTSTGNLAIADNEGVRVGSSIQQRATAAGSLNPPGSAYLALTFNAAISCSDAGDYRCEYAQEVQTGPGTINKTLSATTNPGIIQMFVRPNLNRYDVNASVELECAGEVGFPVVGSWRWETRDVNFASSWTPIRPGIQQIDDPNTGTGCRRTGRSTLRFPVQLEDDNLMYRCSFRSDQYSANFTFDVIAPGGGGSSGPSTGNNDAPGTANVGMIVGIVLGVLALIAVVVVLVFFLVFKKKRNRADDYDTGEGKEGRTYPDEDLHGNPVYTLPNKDKYGVDNEAMDGHLEGKDQDPGDRHRSKPRRGHQDDRPNGGEGRRHRDRHDRDHDRDRDDGHYANDRRYPSDPNEEPYPESRHYSSYEEDDGTDNRGYVPQEAIGSAV